MTRFIKTRKEIMRPKKSNKNVTLPVGKLPTSKLPKENHVPDVKKKVCSYYKCGKEAIGRYTVDLDISGLNFCKKHKSEISSALLWTIIGAEELAQHAMGVPPPKKKKRR
jgi:hypothetical protein